MSQVWQKNISRYCSIVDQNQGPKVVNVVSGSQADQDYWRDRLQMTRRDVFRADGETTIVSSLEKTRKGNFLGSINAWMDLRRALSSQEQPPVMLMNMVFGLGKRLSPFTQALTNRKPAFPTPMRSCDGEVYLSTVDAASMSATLWLHHLESSGFRGMIIKWGDEAVIPGKTWQVDPGAFKDVDGIRFVWQTEPTEDLAREKDWVEFEAETRLMTHQFTRQGLDSLRMRLAEHGRQKLVGVNLGSLGISYRLREVLDDVFKEDVADDEKWVDWDPYAWIAFTCQSEAEWKAEAAFEDKVGKSGIIDVENRLPDFYTKVSQARDTFERKYGRPPMIKVLDFGEPYWMDWGLHLSLRRSLEALATDSDLGATSRELFQLPQERDKNGNIVLRSTVAKGADIRDSLLVDTVIIDPGTVIRNGVVVAGRHRKLEMPYGGSALFCAAAAMKFTGPHAIAFKSIGDEIRLGEGDRTACLFFAEGGVEMRSNEAITDYEGENYALPVMGNPMSFEEATRRMSSEDTRLVEQRWSEQWSRWLE